MHTQQFAEHFNVVEAFLPVNIATAANDGDWVSLKGYSASAPSCSSRRALAALRNRPPSRSSRRPPSPAPAAKALACIDTVYQKQAATNLQSTGTWTKVTQAAAATYALGSGANGDKAALVAITIHAEAARRRQRLRLSPRTRGGRRHDVHRSDALHPRRCRATRRCRVRSSTRPCGSKFSAATQRATSRTCQTWKANPSSRRDSPNASPIESRHRRATPMSNRSSAIPIR
jgi:hypothetical protein